MHEVRKRIDRGEKKKEETKVCSRFWFGAKNNSRLESVSPFSGIGAVNKNTVQCLNDGKSGPNIPIKMLPSHYFGYFSAITSKRFIWSKW